MLPLIKYISWIAILLSSTAALATVQSLEGSQPLEGTQPEGNFQPLNSFGDNPGELTASYLQPSKRAKSLVVLLHGCVQNGEILAEQSGFVALAKQHNFILLLPQQSQNNNVKSCFNWFSEQDSAQDQGEVLSIKNMISAVKTQASIEQVYIAGLSAGGAMTSALLTHYPELFSAGAVIAGLPYPCANDLAKAISCMRNGPSQSATEFVNLAKKGNETVKKWPRLIVITGSNDKVVNPKNSSRLAVQWSKLAGKSLIKSKISAADYQLTLWQDNEHQPQVKLVEINDIGHGLTVNSALEDRDTSAPFLFESSHDSALDIVEFWGFKWKTQ